MTEHFPSPSWTDSSPGGRVKSKNQKARSCLTRCGVCGPPCTGRGFSFPPALLPHPLPHEALRKFTSFAGNQPSQSENRFSSCQPFPAVDFPERVPVPFIACGTALACTPESRHPVCSQNNASFFPSLFPWVIHSPVVLEPALLQRIPQSWWGCCHSLPACCAQPATAGKPCPSDVILFRSYTTIQMPDIVSVPVVCYPVYSSLIYFFKGFEI